jgi:hypothetical protein
MRNSPSPFSSPCEILSQWPKTASSSRTNVRDLGFLPPVEMTKAMFSMQHSVVVEGEDKEEGA